MNIINILFDWDWCAQPGVQDAFNVIRGVLNILRIVVPIILVIMTTLDITKKVINPDEKEGQEKIMRRAIAALIVFLIPTFIKITFRVIDWGRDQAAGTSYDQSKSGLRQCWEPDAN